MYNCAHALNTSQSQTYVHVRMYECMYACIHVCMYTEDSLIVQEYIGAFEITMKEVLLVAIVEGPDELVS